MPIHIFLGTGGVGKTSVAAASALKAARAGSKCLVLTIDPAMRLRTALGMEPGGMDQKVPLDLHHGKGEFWASMLDVHASLDRAVLSESKPGEAKAILDHPLYKVLATSLAGMQELMAIERIHQGMADGFESIFIDTAPSRHALEFLDKPEFFAHLVSFPIVKLVGRTYQWWLASGLGRLSSMSFELYRKVEELLGAQLVHQVLEFFSIFRKFAEGYADRAEKTLKVLHNQRATSFTIVTTPFKAMRDGEYFFTELTKRKFTVDSMVVNRIWPGIPAKLPDGMPSQMEELLVWYQSVSDAQQKVWKDVGHKFSARIPKLIALPELSKDVDGLSALSEIAHRLESAGQKVE